MTFTSGRHRLDRVTIGAIKGSGTLDDTPNESSLRVFSKREIDADCDWELVGLTERCREPRRKAFCRVYGEVAIFFGGVYVAENVGEKEIPARLSVGSSRCHVSEMAGEIGEDREEETTGNVSSSLEGPADLCIVFMLVEEDVVDAVRDGPAPFEGMLAMMLVVKLYHSFYCGVLCSLLSSTL